MDTNAKPLVIDVVSDVVCPWCFIGKRRLEQALVTSPELSVNVRWHPYQLDPTIPPGGLDRREYMNNKFGAERYAQISAHITEVGAEVGIEFRFADIVRSPNTMDAHRLIRWADAAGLQGAMKERLMQAFFVEVRDIGDHGVLTELASEVGLEKAVVARLLAGDADKDKVREEVEMAQKIGVTGVPFFIFAQKLAVSGAQTAEILRGAMLEAAAASV